MAAECFWPITSCGWAHSLHWELCISIGCQRHFQIRNNAVWLLAQRRGVEKPGLIDFQLDFSSSRPSSPPVSSFSLLTFAAFPSSWSYPVSLTHSFKFFFLPAVILSSFSFTILRFIYISTCNCLPSISSPLFSHPSSLQNPFFSSSVFPSSTVIPFLFLLFVLIDLSFSLFSPFIDHLSFLLPSSSSFLSPFLSYPISLSLSFLFLITLFPSSFLPLISSSFLLLFSLSCTPLLLSASPAPVHCVSTPALSCCPPRFCLSVL